MTEGECHCGKDGHALGSINCPVHGTWRPIKTAPNTRWIIGYTSWGQHVGVFHEWVGPCEWITDHFEFANTDFDVFPLPTHWSPWPEPKGQH